jgi:hypothetical protein
MSGVTNLSKFRDLWKLEDRTIEHATSFFGLTRAVQSETIARDRGIPRWSAPNEGREDKPGFRLQLIALVGRRRTRLIVGWRSGVGMISPRANCDGLFARQ